MTNTPYALDFAEITLKDLARVGGKNASLGELFRALKPKGWACSTASRRRRTCTDVCWTPRVSRIGCGRSSVAFDSENLAELSHRGEAARAAVLETRLPDDLRNAILAGYERLCSRLGREPELAVRSSATAEDLPEASFAGAAETFLNVRGREALVPRRPCVLFVAVHGSRDQLPRAARVRPAESCAVGRHHADGPIRQGELRRSCSR